MGLQVIGAGFGRTGTYSLKLALDRLGLGPCHHMEEVMKQSADQVPLWEAAARGAPDWPRTFANFASACDWPSAHYWRELMEFYPQAKVILTTRSAESWYDSISETILPLLSMPDKWPPPVAPVLRMGAEIVNKKTFDGRWRDRDHALAVFRNHEDTVKRDVPAARLLVFDVKEGWGPLCRFLGKPVLDEAFPRSNAKEEFWERIKNPPQG